MSSSFPAVAAVPGFDDAADPVEAAREHIVTSALRATPAPASVTTARVGLELEFHLVDLTRPGVRPTWDQVTALVAGLPPMPSGSAVTTEPGGQVELSTPPTDGIAASVAALGADRAVLRSALAAAGFGAVPLGADPARAPRRINPAPRYAAMQRHFAAVGCVEPGTAMMTATAALQVNVDAGPEAGWADRLRLIHSLGPVLVAASASSPFLGGQASGWASMRQEAWHGIDHGRSDPVPGSHPTEDWAAYALDAPVMLVRDGVEAAPVIERVPFRAWLRGTASIDRRPTVDDLDYHLTTLFPPVRPRGYVEIRCLDALPDRWWPALAALTATLVDDPVAADAAAGLTEPVRDAWVAAARDGLADPAVGAAVRGCVAVAVDRCDPLVRPDLERLAELVDAGRTPGDELRGRMTAADPITVLEEEARV
jgi:glutamate--cysteine ligase